MNDQIILKDMEFYGYHGCGEEEQRIGQIFRVDATFDLDLSRAGKSDKIDDTVDYSKAFEIIKAIVIGTPRKLIETVAEEIATTLLNRFGMIAAVKIVIYKPSPPIVGMTGTAAVSITRRRA